MNLKAQQKPPSQSQTNTRYYFAITFGCQMNEYDSRRMADLLQQEHQFLPTNDAQQADLLLMNTCSIREKAQEKIFSQLGRWRPLKQKKPSLLIVVAGCVASQEGEKIKERAPYVDIIIGPQTIHRLGALIQKREQTGQIQIDVSFPEIEKFDHLPAPQKQKTSAYLSVMEGCNKYCSYCIVPYTRGEEISRRFDQVIDEASTLAQQGACEITLLGQNVNDYDGLMHEGDRSTLATLIYTIATLPQIKRIRFTTSHPGTFSQELIEVYQHEPKLTSHLHLPVQSGSNQVLKAMKRDYTRQEYLTLIDKIRQARPQIIISTDIIVGFPGETEADFQQTLSLVNTVGFDNSFCFIYSPRPGTPASQLGDEVTLNEKKERLARLQAALKKTAGQISRNLLGKTVSVLIEKISQKSTNEVSGRTESNRIINLPGNPTFIGKILPITITQILTTSLRGRLATDLTAQVE